MNGENGSFISNESEKDLKEQLRNLLLSIRDTKPGTVQYKRMYLKIKELRNILKL